MASLSASAGRDDVNDAAGFKDGAGSFRVDVIWSYFFRSFMR